ncbi:MAG: tetratricopeptide repeat protein, partial [Candidatus Eremiobacteraeota bacterium]|nr:tetratricopeptide repeat protein [Candidatus Eremiobacteraeota bacterium]
FVKAHPGDRDAERSLGDAYVRTGRLDLAETAYLNAAAASPGDKSVHDRLGNLYAREDRVPEAIREFERALPDVAAYAGLVALHRHLGDLDAFVANYRSRADGAPLDGAAQFAFGTILLQLHQPEAALVYLGNALRADPRSCAALTELGNARLDIGATSEAVDSFQRCLAIDPHDYSALVDLSNAYGPLQDAAARALLRTAISVRPNRPEAFVDIGYLDDNEGSIDKAIASFQHALALDPFSRDAYVDLGFSYIEQGNYQLAEATFLRGLSVSHEDGHLEYLLGKSFERQGKLTLALREYRSASKSEEPAIAAAASHDLAASR